jgi:hypothetical protein
LCATGFPTFAWRGVTVGPTGILADGATAERCWRSFSSASAVSSQPAPTLARARAALALSVAYVRAAGRSGSRSPGS